MNLLDIRIRVLLVAWLPVALVATLLAAVFLPGRLGDFEAAHEQRARSLVRQIASASEYGLFSGNSDNLRAIATGGLREADVRSVTILDAQGRVLVRTGTTGLAPLPALGPQELAWHDAQTRHDWLVQPILSAQLPLDEVFDERQLREQEPRLLGHVLLELSREAVAARQREMLLVDLIVTLGGLLLGGFLAVRISQGVLRPIERVSDMIERIGRGELSARAAVLSDDPLRDLHKGLNQMAERLQQGRDELEHRIALATLALRAKKEEAETATLAKSRFLASASHDLRQPTHALGLFVSRLAQLPHDEEMRHLIAHLELSVQALQDLLDALLDICRLDAGMVKVERKAFAVSELFKSLHNDLSQQAEDKGLRLRIRPSAAWVMSDPVLLHRILLNLLSNALRYTEHGGVLLACRPSRDGSHVRIELWDSGIGIAPEHQEDIFKEFFQIGNLERDRNKGLGLGLNIVKRTADLLASPLRLCSEPGRGTRFSIELPRASAAVRVVSAPAEPSLPDDLGGLAVLLIEDDAMSATALAGLLQSWGCSVRVVGGLDEARSSLAQGFQPDVLISDYRLRQGENGIDTLRWLRAAIGRQVAACLVSGDTDPGLMQGAKEAGLILLHKPVRPAKLRSLIRRLAQDRRAGGAGLSTDTPDD